MIARIERTIPVLILAALLAVIPVWIITKATEPPPDARHCAAVVVAESPGAAYCRGAGHDTATAPWQEPYGGCDEARAYAGTPGAAECEAYTAGLAQR